MVGSSKPLAFPAYPVVPRFDAQFAALVDAKCSYSPPCPHATGFWTSIPRRVWLFCTVRWRVFVCEDCMTILDDETKEPV